MKIKGNIGAKRRIVSLLRFFRLVGFVMSVPAIFLSLNSQYITFMNPQYSNAIVEHLNRKTNNEHPRNF